MFTKVNLALLKVSQRAKLLVLILKTLLSQTQHAI